MQSATKNHQPLSVLREMTARAYGPELVPTTDDFVREVTEGWFNVIYEVRLLDGRRVALKIAPPADVTVLTGEIGMMRSELEAMRLVREHSDVPVPRVDHVDLTHELVDADWFFMEFIEGENFETFMKRKASTEESASGYRQLGAFNREINSIVGPHFGPVLGAGFKTWREAFVSMFETTLWDGESVGVELGWEPNRIRQVIADNATSLDEVTIPRLVEVDLWAKNSIIRDGKIVGILDHERAIFGDPLMEACFAGIDLPAFGDPTDFAAGYGLKELSESERVRRRLYSLYLTVIMIVETKYRRHADTVVYDFARAELDTMMGVFGHQSGR